MSVYFAPGWGSDLGRALGQMREGIQNLVNPYRHDQRAFEQSLSDPQELRRLANEYSMNPEAFTQNRMINQQSKDLLAQTVADPTFRLNNEVSTAGLEQMTNPQVRSDAGRAEVGARTNEKVKSDRLGNQQAQVNLDLSNLKLTEIKELNKFLSQNPDIKQRHLMAKSIGMQQEQLGELERQAGLIAEGEALKDINAIELVRSMQSGDLDAVRKWEAFTAANPNAAKNILNQLDMKDRQRIEMSLIGARRAGSKADENEFLFNRSMEVARNEANRLRVPLNAVIVARGMHEQFPTQLRGVTASDEEVGQVLVADQAIRNQERQKLVNTSLRNIMSILQDLEANKAAKENRGLRASLLQQELNNMYDGTGRHINVEFVGMSGNKLRYTDQDGNEIKESDILSPTFHLSDRPIEGVNARTDRPPSVAPNEKAGLLRDAKAKLDAGEISQADYDAFVKYLDSQGGRQATNSMTGK